jgi:hypothetical protein
MSGQPDPPRRWPRRGRRVVLALAVVGLLSACTSSPPAGPSSSASATSPAKPSNPAKTSHGAKASDSASPGKPPTTPGTGTALAALAQLTVKGRAPLTGYSRAAFGEPWYDANGNGCDTRDDVLRRDLTHTRASGCTVLSGTIKDPYTVAVIAFHRAGSYAHELDIDHVVALGDAWQTGAANWTFTKRVALANDLTNLLAVDPSANRQKGDADAASWLPPNKAYRCAYVARQIDVKKGYGLWVTPAEKTAMARVLAACPTQRLPGPVHTRVSGAPTASRPTPSHSPTASGSGLDPRYSTCKEAKAHGYGPYRRGVDPEYYWYRDADHDGIDCE